MALKILNETTMSNKKSQAKINGKILLTKMLIVILLIRSD